ncbi:MAG: flagellar biosynthesis anti-sigma factor FlgM [Pirellulales bacterium]|jgi:negative regulator of flagellin synthesis FlgM|nr:flagellar biosynthesis anti-sigma factor FlgM [Pirellulales bacterium]
MQIYGPNYIHGPQAIRAPHTTSPAAAPRAAAATQGADQVEISQAAQLASKLSEIPDIRHERVQSLRAAIADGSYETGDKLDGALERLLDEIG